MNATNHSNISNSPVEVRDYLVLMREHFASYHHQKELMGYGAVTIFVTATTALISQQPPVWKSGVVDSRIFIGAMVLMSVVTLLFTAWQLKMRRDAAHMVRACDEIINELLSGKTQADGLSRKIETFDGRDLPSFLRDRVNDVSKKIRWQLTLIISELLSLIVLVAWDAVLFWAFFLTP